MRIAWITYGFGEYSAYHVNALNQDHDLFVAIPSMANGATHCPMDASIDLFAFPSPRLREPLKQWRLAREIVKRVHDFQPDVVHFQHGHMWFNLVLKSLRKYPLVITIHDPRHHAGDRNSRKTPQWLMDYGFRKADDVIVHGEALAGEVQEIFGFERERIHVVPMVTLGDETMGNEIAEDESLILFFGRIWDYKGLDQLIAAQPLISEVLPDVRIMIAGQGEDFGKYQAMMEDPSKFIVHNAWISDEQRARFFRQSSVVVLPYNEATQSGVVPVAYNYSKPVVATRVGALPEFVDHGVTGLLIPPRDPQAIADAVVDLLKNPARRHQLGKAGKAKLDRECSPAAVAKQTATVYRAAIAHRGFASDAPAISTSETSLPGRHGTKMMRKGRATMRVVMICPELPRDDLPGTMAPTARQIESLRELGLSIDVVDMRGISKLKYLQVIPRIRRISRQVDVIHAHFGYCGWLGRLAPAFSLARAPLVISFMGSDLLGTPYNPEGDLKWFSTRMVRANQTLAWKASQVIVKSQQMAKVIAPAPSTVIPNGVDVNAFRPMDRGAVRHELNLPRDRKLVLFPGNPNNPRKGHQLAAIAVQFASRQMDQPVDLVPLTGVQPDQVPIYMNACDAMVMTSLLEGSPNVVKEAMACNVPVIGVPVGDVEQLLDGVQGCEFCTRDPGAIGSAIVRALDTPHVAGRQAIFNRGLDLESVARRIVTVYEQAIGRKIQLPSRSAPTDAVPTGLRTTSVSS